ncbi:hypothetical protein ACHAXS_011200 [Conticribra weissflogii]
MLPKKRGITDIFPRWPLHHYEAEWLEEEDVERLVISATRQRLSPDKYVTYVALGACDPVWC